MSKIEIKPQDHPDFVGGWVWTPLEARWIEERIAEAILAEREACAKVCDEFNFGQAPMMIQKAIRAREQA